MTSDTTDHSPAEGATLRRSRRLIQPACTFTAPDGTQILVVPRVGNVIAAAVMTDPFVERAGLLAGRVMCDEHGSYVVVSSATPVLDAASNADGVTMTPDQLRAATSELTAGDPAAHVIGWWHSHTDGDAVYSATDRVAQALWTNAFSVGLLAVDGAWSVSPRLVAYLGPQGVPCATDSAQCAPAHVRRRVRSRRWPIVVAAALCGAVVGSVGTKFVDLMQHDPPPPVTTIPQGGRR